MDRFGVPYMDAPYVSYYYDTDDLPILRKELKIIEETIGKEQLKKLQNFFKEPTGYNDKMIEEAEINPNHLSDYFDYAFAKKVEAYIIEHGDCSFDVEI